MIRSHGVRKEIYDLICSKTDSKLCGCDLSVCEENSPDRAERKCRTEERS